MECPLIPSWLETCAPEDRNMWNESSPSYRPELLLNERSATQKSLLPTPHHQEPTRSHLYNLFRRAAVSHGFGSEYQSELRNLLGQNWINSWAIWTLAVPGTFLLGVIAHIFVKNLFGRLRMSERQHIRERLWNYAFYKFIFIFGVVNVESVEEMIIWVDWFVILGYIHFLIVLSRDRCEYMTFSPAPVSTAHDRIVTLLALVVGVSVAILTFSCYISWLGFLHTGLFVAAEGFLILLPTWHILLRYGFHHLRQGRSTAKWEKRTGLYYYLNFFCETGTLFVDLSHHVHMMCEVCNLSASSLVIVAQIRFLCVELINKYRRHRNYVAIQKRLQGAFPQASEEEIVHHDGPCSICWDTLEEARKLNCGHIFHEICLLSWLEQDISCPICRIGLNDIFDLGRRQGRRTEEGGRFFTFEGSRINRWLPNVSVTVSHPLYEYVDNTRSVEVMAEQVRQVFPNVSHHAILEDLLETGSAEATIENLLSGVFNFSRPLPEVSASSVQLTSGQLCPISNGSVGGMVPDSPEARRAMQIQRKETILYEARKNFLARLADEKARQSGRPLPPSAEEPQLSPN